MKIKDVLKEGKKILKDNKIEDSEIISRVLLQYALNLSRNELIIKQDDELEKNIEKEYIMLINKAAKGIPMQYLTHNQEFYGLNFYVDENVLIPQPDTEILVEETLKRVKGRDKILDICTGSGCIGISLAKNIEDVQITLSDISKEALKIAMKNAENNKVVNKIKIIESDLFKNIHERFNIVVSNPPYIETKTLETLSMQVQNEPKIALDGGEDGLKFYRSLLSEAYKYLEKGGFLCMEIGYNQKEKVINIANEIGKYERIETIKDLERK